MGHLSRRDRSSKVELCFTPRLSIHLGQMCATNTFDHERPLGDILRRSRASLRLAITVFGDGLELGASSSILHRSTYSKRHANEDRYLRYARFAIFAAI